MMDLEELKSLWASVDERLGKQELVKESIIREMIRDKSNKSLRKLLNYEIFSLGVCLFVLPVIVSLLYIDHFRVYTQWVGKVFVGVMIVICSAAAIWSLIKIAKLMKVDFTKNVRSNSLIISRYSIWIGKEKIVTICLTPVCCFLCIWLYTLVHVNVATWTGGICGLLFGLFLTFYIYKRVYGRNIEVVRQSLEELKDLEEEKEKE
jgi:hypothetical protein